MSEAQCSAVISYRGLLRRCERQAGHVGAHRQARLQWTDLASGAVSHDAARAIASALEPANPGYDRDIAWLERLACRQRDAKLYGPLQATSHEEVKR